MELLVYVGVAISFIGGIGFLIAAFRESILWGLGCFFIFPVSLVFLILHWQVAKNPFLLQLVGIGIIFLAAHFGAEVSL